MEPLTQDVVRDLLSGISDAGGQRLAEVMSASDFEGSLSAALVSEVVGLEGAPSSVSELMIVLLPIAQTYAVCPISNFKVGAVIEGDSGALHFGANFEAGGHALGFTIHAEQSAVAHALAHSETGVRRIAVTAAPCGHCRQFLNELPDAGRLSVLLPGRDAAVLSDLLPDYR